MTDAGMTWFGGRCTPSCEMVKKMSYSHIQSERVLSFFRIKARSKKEGDRNRVV